MSSDQFQVCDIMMCGLIGSVLDFVQAVQFIGIISATVSHQRKCDLNMHNLPLLDSDLSMEKKAIIM